MLEISENELEISDVLGFGTYGTVKKACWKTHLCPVAVKVFNNADAFKEFELMRELKHKNIVQVIGVCHNNLQSAIVMELAENGSLESKIDDGGYQFENCYSWLLQCIIALEYLHSNQVVHRDVKPGNLLLFDNCETLKICDFGLSRIIDSSMTLQRGTIVYMAPEVLNRDIHQHSKKYDERCDIYSWALIFVQLFTREVPFSNHGKTSEDLLIPIGTGVLRPEFLPEKFKIKVPEDGILPIQNLVQRCWNIDYVARPFAGKIVRILREWKPE